MIRHPIVPYQIGEKKIEYDESCSIISIEWYTENGSNRVNIALTPTEMLLIKSLLDSHYKKEADLDQEIYRARPTRLHDSKKSISAKHIANLRLKLRIGNLDILRIQKYGYILSDFSNSDEDKIL